MKKMGTATMIDVESIQRDALLTGISNRVYYFLEAFVAV
jgi:hypothetical protein